MTEFSVCLATFNGMPFVRYQIESILPQLGQRGQLLISDDGSTDGTLEYIASIDDERVVLMPSRSHLGVVGNFDRLIAESNTQYVFLSDQDDIWMPNKVEIVLENLRSGADLVVHDAYILIDNENPTKNTYFERLTPTTRPWRNLHTNTLIGAMMAMNRRAIDWSTPIPKGVGMHDIWIGLVVGTLGRIKLVNTPLMYYRRHNNNATATLSQSNRPLHRKLTERGIAGLALLQKICFGQTSRQEQEHNQ